MWGAHRGRGLCSRACNPGEAPPKPRDVAGAGRGRRAPAWRAHPGAETRSRAHHACDRRRRRPACARAARAVSARQLGCAAVGQPHSGRWRRCLPAARPPTMHLPGRAMGRAAPTRCAPTPTHNARGQWWRWRWAGGQLAAGAGSRGAREAAPVGRSARSALENEPAPTASSTPPSRLAPPTAPACCSVRCHRAARRGVESATRACGQGARRSNMRLAFTPPLLLLHIEPAPSLILLSKQGHCRARPPLRPRGRSNKASPSARAARWRRDRASVESPAAYGSCPHHSGGGLHPCHPSAHPHGPPLPRGRGAGSSGRSAAAQRPPWRTRCPLTSFGRCKSRSRRRRPRCGGLARPDHSPRQSASRPCGRPAARPLTGRLTGALPVGLLPDRRAGRPAAAGGRL